MRCKSYYKILILWLLPYYAQASSNHSTYSNTDSSIDGFESLGFESLSYGLETNFSLQNAGWAYGEPMTFNLQTAAAENLFEVYSLLDGLLKNWANSTIGLIQQTQHTLFPAQNQRWKWKIKTEFELASRYSTINQEWAFSWTEAYESKSSAIMPNANFYISELTSQHTLDDREVYWLDLIWKW